jgi:hypothetical protein
MGSRLAASTSTTRWRAIDPACIVEHEPLSFQRSHFMTNHPLYDIAAALARIFVVVMTVTAFVAVPIMLAIALL